MDKFLVRQASAEGIKLDAMKEAIRSIASYEAQLQGVYHLDNHFSVEELAATISNSVRTCGGYMFTSDTWYADEIGGAECFHYELRWVKDKPFRTDVEENMVHNVEMLNFLEVGKEVHHVHECNEDTHDTYIKQPDGSWVHTYHYSEQERKWATQVPVFLFPGIRQQVADRLSVPLSSTFHKCFDACVDTFYA